MAIIPNPFDLILDELRQLREEIRALQVAPSKTEEPPADWMRAEDLAKRYKLPKTLFEEAGREGDIERTRPGRHVLFNVRSVERYLKSRAAGGNSTDH